MWQKKFIVGVMTGVVNQHTARRAHENCWYCLVQATAICTALQIVTLIHITSNLGLALSIMGVIWVRNGNKVDNRLGNVPNDSHKKITHTVSLS